MLRADIIEADGVIVSVLPGTVFRVELANGHRFLAFPRRRSKSAALRLAIGDRVKVEMTPFDLSKGRLILNVS